MRRVTLLLLFGSLGLVGCLLSAAPPASSRAPAPPGRPNTLRLPRVRPGEKLAAKLNDKADWQGINDPKTTLFEALDQLAKWHEITFDINETAFKEDKVDDVVTFEIAKSNPLPAVK